MKILPGLYSNIPEREYHAREFGPRESLSSTEAKRILEAPAVMNHWRNNQQPENPAYDLGRAVHALVLGTGAYIHVIKSASLRTVTGRAEADEARANGLLPMNRTMHRQARAMADAVLAHAVAAEMLTGGEPEVSAFSHEKDDGMPVWLRGRFDYLRRSDDTIIDVKTARTAQPDAWQRSATTYGYHVQRAFYARIYRAITGHYPRFLHVVVEKNPPYLVAVIEMDATWNHVADQHVETAVRTYRQCLATGEWPGIPETVHTLPAPAWWDQGDDEMEW